MLYTILLLAAAGFTVLTTEFLIVGLLPGLARDLHVSVAQAGLLVSLFAFTVAVTGPLLTARVAARTGPQARRRVFVVILVLVALSNALAAVAPNLGVLAIARLVPALGVAVFWSLACEAAVAALGAARAGRALSIMAYGMVGATVFGIPLGTLIGDAFGWRTAFGVLAALALVKALLLTRLPPTAATSPPLPFAAQLRLARQPAMLGHVALSVLSFTGMFIAYTYLADFLERLGGLSGPAVGWTLMAFGAMGLVGNHLGGRLVDRSALRATLVFSGWLAISLALVAWAAPWTPALFAVLAVWGIAQSALFIVNNVRLMQAAPSAQALGSALNISGANAGIGIGAILGGRVIDGPGIAWIGVAAAAVVVGSAVLAWRLLGRPAAPSVNRAPRRDACDSPQASPPPPA